MGQEGLETSGPSARSFVACNNFWKSIRMCFTVHFQLLFYFIKIVPKNPLKIGLCSNSNFSFNINLLIQKNIKRSTCELSNKSINFYSLFGSSTFNIHNILYYVFEDRLKWHLYISETMLEVLNDDAPTFFEWATTGGKEMKSFSLIYGNLAKFQGFEENKNFAHSWIWVYFL